MEKSKIYEDIATRTSGDIYLGIVGPVRTGKSTFIKRFMETMVIPKIDNEYLKERAKDELPQSGSGRTIMTAEPKFVPEEAVSVSLDGETSLSVRLIDCVGYLVDGAIGHTEDGGERMVTTPWFDTEIPMSQAAEVGTAKVIREHSTIGIVVTTDGSITDIPRSSYVEAEEKVVSELKEIGKPFVILLNCENPNSDSADALREELEEKYSVACIPINCMTITENEITNIIAKILDEFPIYEYDFFFPSWFERLAGDNAVRSSVISDIREAVTQISCVRDMDCLIGALEGNENVSDASIKRKDMGTGTVAISVNLPSELFYSTISEISGLDISDGADLVDILKDLAHVKAKYERIASALDDVENTGYGIVIPDTDELVLREPEIVRHGGRYSVKLKASAPSIHMIKTTVETEVSPAVGGEKSSGDMISFLLQEFEGDASKIWDTNIFGKSLHDIAGDNLQTKIRKMPIETQNKLRETLQRIINEGSGGLICIIL